VYCYTYINEFSCIFNELQLWSYISADHPNFLKTVAKLSNVPLPQPTIDKLDDIHKSFQTVYNNVLYLKKIVVGNPSLNNQHVMAVKKTIDEFMFHDSQVLSFYPQLFNFGKDNMSWQELVKHIISEQTFMIELFQDLEQQIQ
jgi:hypothetical protein